VVLKSAGRNFGLFCGVIFLSAQARASDVRYIVRVKGGAESLRQYNVRNLSLELRSQGLRAPGSAPAQDETLARLGFVIAKGDPRDIENMLARDPSVSYFERDVEWQPTAVGWDATPSSYPMSPWASDVLHLPESKGLEGQASSGATPVIVAIVDTGATIDHPYLKPALAENAAEKNGKAGVDDDGNGIVDDIYGANVTDKTGNVDEVSTDHGSHVAGLVKLVRDKALENYPAAANVEILPVRFINEKGYGSTSDAILALAYAASRGARVVNASWGAGGDEAFSQALYDTMVDLYEKHDVFISVAAGNAEYDGPNNNDVIPYFPSSFNIPSLMSVGSVTPTYEYDSDGEMKLSSVLYSDFSNYGPHTVHIAAPGGYRDADHDASGLYSVNAHYSSDYDLYVRKKGTSMAAPLVAGVAAVVRAINPQLTSYEVKNLILSTATKDDRYKYVQSSALLNAGAAFEQAKVAKSHGEHPKVSGDAYNVYNSADLEHKSPGGCGAVSPVGNGTPPEGPFGGNSLILFATLYLVRVFTRQLRRKEDSHSV
jgi:subtilisin family serine protease